MSRHLIEALDARVLFSSSLSIETLTVTGTPGADLIVVAQTKDQIIANDNGAIARYALVSVGRIDIDGGDGNDRIICNVHLPTRVQGGAGNDLIVGGSAADILFGNAGNDIIIGRGGGDFIHGGPGINRLAGGDGDDTFNAFGRDDRVDGGAGSDTLLALAQSSRDRNVESLLSPPGPSGQFTALSVTSDANGNAFATVSFFSPALYDVEIGPAVRHGTYISIDVYTANASIPGFNYDASPFTTTRVVPLGHLPAGAYTLTSTTTLGLVQATTFVISSPSAPVPLSAISKWIFVTQIGEDVG
jgi:Ca2+-binding RTX toxin-like protein